MVALLSHDSEANRGELDHSHIITTISDARTILNHFYTMQPVTSLSFSVIKAFWVGKQRQQMTAGAFLATSKKREELLVLRMLVSAGPSTSKTCSA